MQNNPFIFNLKIFRIERTNKLKNNKNRRENENMKERLKKRENNYCMSQLLIKFVDHTYCL